LSQLPLARWPLLASKATQETGAVWPLRRSVSLPVCSAQTCTAKGSMLPATTTSPDGSAARLMNCAGLAACGSDVKVRKFLYRSRS
jgi:hypothetical protein